MSRKEYVGLPTAPARYEIFRAEYVRLVERDVVCLQPITDYDGQEMELLDADRPEPPGIDTILPHYRDLPHVSGGLGPTQILNNHAKDCGGVSGRKLANMPSIAIGWHTDKETCFLGEALEVLGREIAELRQR